MDSRSLRVKPFAEKYGFSHLTILAARTKIETCKLGTLERIARALGVRVCELFEEQPDQEPAFEDTSKKKGAS